jgi:hypothetical protein
MAMVSKPGLSKFIINILFLLKQIDLNHPVLISKTMNAIK